MFINNISQKPEEMMYLIEAHHFLFLTLGIHTFTHP